MYKGIGRASLSIINRLIGIRGVQKNFNDNLYS